MRIAYFDCFSGAAGNMILGALLECGLEPEVLVEGLRGLQLGDWELRVRPVLKRTIGATYVEVLVEGESADAPTVIAEHHHHGHHHHGPGGHHHPHHEHRHHRHPRQTGSLAAILERIRQGGLPGEVSERACTAFRNLAEAEARVHRTSPEEVHFHEVGAVDALVDVVGSVLGLHLLGVEKVYCSPLPQGHGFVRAAHGRLPVPAPATAYLLRGAPVCFVDVPGELVTPTGAAILATLARFESPPLFTPTAVGHGAGRSEYEHPNLLRLFVGDTVEGPRPQATLPSGPGHEGDTVVCEAHLDDMNPQLLGAVMDRLFAEGALDVAFSPLQMKKDRPGVRLTAVAPQALAERIAAVVLAETSSLGVRWHPVWRRTLPRRHVTVETPFGPIRVKVSGEGESLHRTPEMDDCREAATRHGVPLRRVYEAALAQALQL